MLNLPVVLLACFHVSGGCSPITIDFVTAEACNEARYELWIETKDRPYGRLAYSKCIDKRTGETVSIDD